MTRPPASYRLVSAALAAPLAAHALARAGRDGGWLYLRERYGYVRGPGAPDTVWLHCASVGEVSAAMPLAAELAEAGVGPLLVTTSTPTGRARAERLAPTAARIAYLPLDRPGPVRRFLARARPRLALIVETELWPHLYGALARRDIPIVLVNGRLSGRTLEAPRWWREAARWCLQRTTAVLARSDADARAFVGLGAAPARVEALGNLKLAGEHSPPDRAIELGRPFVLAASTHDDEELQLARAWRRADGALPLLAIAPRHPERGEALARRLAEEGLTVSRRSLGEPVTPATAVYLADTLGELRALMAAAQLVIMGGSLVPRGGQNVLEPAHAARAIVTGPHMENFADETERLAAAGGLLRCDSADAVVAAVARLLADEGRRAAMGAAARAAVAADADIAARYRRRLSALLGERLSVPAAASASR